MRKLFKVMFSQTTIVALLIVLQLAFLAVTFLQLAPYFVYVSWFFRFLSIVAVLQIINKKGNPSYKLAWIVPILLFPFLGGVFYLYVMGQKLPIIMDKRFKRIKHESAPHQGQDSAVLSELESLDRQVYNAAAYLSANADVTVHKNTDAVFYSLGEYKWAAMMAEMEKAERYIFLEYFIIADGEMWESVLNLLKRKVRQGVEVRLMYDGMGCLTHLPGDYPAIMEEFGIKCRVFNPFVPLLSTIQNNRDHRKILVIDGHTAFTGGINLSDEYVNVTHPYGHWKDTAVMLKGEGAYAYALMFLEMWQMSDHHSVDYAAFLPEKGCDVKNDGFVISYDDSPLDGEQIGEYVYLHLINTAERFVHIETPYLILDQELITALCHSAKSGVDVKLILPAKADHWYAHAVARSIYPELLSQKVRIFEYTPGFIHSKAFSIDGESAVVGTINMDYRSLSLHFECASWFYRHKVVADVEEDFQATLEKCREVKLEDCKTGPITSVVYAVLRLFAPLM